MTNIYKSIYPISNDSSAGIFSLVENREPELFNLRVSGSPSSTSHDSNPFENVYTPSKTGSWWSTNTQNSYFQIFIHSFQVRLTHFVFVTYDFPGRIHPPCSPVNWKIEGFNGSWFLIQQYYSSELHQYNFTKVFSVDHPTLIQGIKLTQIGMSSRGGSDYHLSASKFDIFGEIHSLSYCLECNSHTSIHSCFPTLSFEVLLLLSIETI